jgi:glycosyltransferase involved in cell wall biosynthesis
VSSPDNISRPPAPLASISPSPRIDILLPSKERFGPRNAGAISGVVHDLITASQTPNLFHVFGHPVDAPFDDVAFTGIAPRQSWLYGSNLGLAKAYLHTLKTLPAPALIEVHSRCHVAAHIAAKRPDLRIALYLHNDPREMNGGRTIAERRKLLKSMATVICVSDYIKNCFLDGLNVDEAPAAKVVTARNGAKRWLSKPQSKRKMILVASRMVPEKGILECATALAQVLATKPDWHVMVAGARRFDESAPGSYEADVAAALAPLGDCATMLGFIPAEDVRKLQQEAAIILCPSLWHDPMPKTVLEALAAGSALLTTRRGGIPEAAEGRAHIVDQPTAETFAAALERLVTDDAYRTGLQETAWQDFPFTASKMADDADTHRAAAIQGVPSATNQRQ